LDEFSLKLGEELFIERSGGVVIRRSFHKKRMLPRSPTIITLNDKDISIVKKQIIIQPNQPATQTIISISQEFRSRIGL
jgi:hypothetical protein